MDFQTLRTFVEVVRQGRLFPSRQSGVHHPIALFSVCSPRRAKCPIIYPDICLDCKLETLSFFVPVVTNDHLDGL
jgi:hypothetical protein